MSANSTYDSLLARIAKLEKADALRQSAESKLADIQKRSHIWLEHSPVCTKIIDADLNLQYMSKAGVKALGIDDITTLYNKPFPPDFYNDSFKKGMVSSLQNVKETGEIVHFEDALIGLNGDTHWFDSTLVPVMDDQGDLDYIIVVSSDSSERKNKEAELDDITKALQLHQEMLGQSADLANIGYSIWDEVLNRDVVISEGMARISGMTKDEYLQNINGLEDLARYIHPDDRARYLAYSNDMKTSIHGPGIKYRWIRPNGEIRYLFEKNKFIPVPYGPPSQSIIAIQDITELMEAEQKLDHAYAEQKKTQSDLKAANQRYELALKSSNAGIWESNFLTGEQYFSPRAAEIITLDVNLDPKLASLDERVHPNDIEMVRSAFANSTPGKSSDLEYRILRDDGKYIWIRNRSFLEYDERGRPLRIAGSIEDITTLKEYDARFERVVEASGGYTYEASKDGPFTYLSDRFEEITGYTPDAMIGRLLSDLVPQSHRQKIMSELKKAANDYLIVRDFEVPIIHKHGQIVWLNITIAPYFDINGDYAGACGSGTDISERKEREIELAQALIKADDANKAKTTFLATMSHEIRTPLNGVLGMSRMLMNSELNDAQKDQVRAVIESGEDLLELLNDILDISKIEENQLELEHTKLNIAHMLRKCNQLWSPRFEQKGILFQTHNATKHLPELAGDPTRYFQVLQNLIANAFKFTDTGEVTVTVHCVGETEQHALIRLEIEDTGIGISEDGQELLFDRFSQVDTSVTRKYGGSGLGLAICRELVTLMDGEIGVNSAPGKGSTFWFTAQLSKLTSEIATDIATNTADQEDIHIMFDHTAKVLVAEDNKVNEKVITAFLKVAGIKADIAEDGVAAVEMSKHQDYDLILMDIQMPELDGLGAAQQIKALSDHYQATPIVALTANASEQDKQYYLKSGMIDFISKPIDPAHLLKTISNYIPLSADSGMEHEVYTHDTEDIGEATSR